MNPLQAVCFALAVGLLVVAAFNPNGRSNLALLAAACALIGYIEPGLAALGR